jgi:3-phytase
MIRAAWIGIVVTYLSFGFTFAQTDNEITLPAAFRIENADAVDQDDHCVWYNAAKPAESRIICSDKSANKVFVYDLRGELKQSLNVPKPGNIDCRTHVALSDGNFMDVVVVNERDIRPSLHVFALDRRTGMLTELDQPIMTGENYGGCLFYDAAASALYAIITAKTGVIEQYRITMDSDKKVRGEKVRSWHIGYCEGAVANDATGELFIAEEDGVVWKLSGMPVDVTPGEKLGRVGELGLVGNLEGLALLRVGSTKEKHLVVSDQSRNRYVVLTTTVPATKVMEFAIESGTHTDGIEISQQNFGPAFPEGIMIVHTDNDKKQPIVVDLRELLRRLDK